MASHVAFIAEPHDQYSGPPISGLAKRIHGWSWQAFPIGMGTGAVYITLAGLHRHPPWVTHIEVSMLRDIKGKL